MNKRYTVKDIARMANVSRGTVDRVIHQRGNVSPEVYEKVARILEEIQYQPNILAKSLQNHRAYRIGVLIPDSTKDAYWNPCLEGIREAISEYKAFGVNIDTYYFDPQNSQDFLERSNELLATSLDAILMVPLYLKESIQFFKDSKKLKVPCVIFNTLMEDENVSSFIGQDLYKSGRVAAHLFHKLLPLGGKLAVADIDEEFENSRHMQEKERGFIDFYNDLENNNYEIIPLRVERDESGKLDQKVKEFIKRHEDLAGVFITTSKAYRIASLLKQAKNTVQIIGYDLVDENVEYIKSGVIDFLIHQNPKEQAYQGISLLGEYLVFGKALPQTKMLPIDIVSAENLHCYTTTI